MDSMDRKAASHLQAAGRESWIRLGEILGVTGPAAAERVRRLEERGVIRGYAALLDPKAVGARLTAFVAVTLQHPKHRRAFLERVESLPEIQECHHVAGDDDYLLKVRCTGTKHLDRLLSDDLKSLPGVLRTRTTIVLGTVKETPLLPLADDDDGNG